MLRGSAALVLAAALMAPIGARADVYEEAARAWQAFSTAYAQLPSGECSHNASRRPYREALSALESFERVAAEIPDRPDLSEHRAVLVDIVDRGFDSCEDPWGGVSFRCDGPCPQRVLQYVETPDLPRFAVAASPGRSPGAGAGGGAPDGWSVIRVEFGNGGWIEKLSNGDWYEFDQNGNRIFRFEEIGRDDWSVYLDDTSRNLQLQLDLHRKLVSFGVDFGPKQDLYRIVGAEGR